MLFCSISLHTGVQNHVVLFYFFTHRRSESCCSVLFLYTQTVYDEWRGGVGCVRMIKAASLSYFDTIPTIGLAGADNWMARPSLSWLPFCLFSFLLFFLFFSFFSPFFLGCSTSSRSSLSPSFYFFSHTPFPPFSHFFITIIIFFSSFSSCYCCFVVLLDTNVYNMTKSAGFLHCQCWHIFPLFTLLIVNINMMFYFNHCREDVLDMHGNWRQYVWRS